MAARRIAHCAVLIVLAAAWIAGAKAGDTSRDPELSVVSGTVLAHTGAPLRGAYVGVVIPNELLHAQGSELLEVCHATTDANGRFSFGVPKGLGSLTFVAKGKGLAPSYSAPVAIVANRHTLRPFSLSPGLQLAGIIVEEESKKLLANVTVTVRRPQERADTIPPDAKRIQAVSTANGSFKFTGLLPEPYVIDLSDATHPPRSLRGLRPPRTNLEVMLFKPSFVAGQVVDSADQPIAEARLEASFAGVPTVRSVADAAGRFRIGPFARGTGFTLTVSADGFGIARTDDISAPENDLRIVLDANGSLRGRVLDEATRQPLHDFRIVFHRRGSVPLRTSPYPGARAFSSDNGSFVWPDIQPGTWTISVESSGYETLEVVGLTISKQSVPSDLQLLMKKGYVLSGRLFNQVTGESVTQAVIDYSPTRLSRADALTRPLAAPPRLDEEGRFVLKDLPAGPGLVTVHADGFSRTVREVSVGRDVDVDIGLLPAATIRGRLVDSDGLAGVPGAVTVLEVAAESRATVRADSEGVFEIPNVSPGRHVISGSTLSGRTSEMELNVGAAQQLSDVILKLNRGRRVEGKVSGLMPGEQGRSQIDVEAPEDFRASVAVSVEGEYQIENVPMGRLVVTATTPLHRQMSHVVESSQSAASIVDFAFPESTYKLQGSVTRAGKPARFVGVIATPLDEQGVTGKGETTLAGRYSIDGLPGGAYSVTLEAGVRTTTRIVLSSDAVLDFQLPDIVISGRVTDADGATPISAALIKLDPMQPTAASRSFAGKSVYTGAFSLAGVIPGDYQLSAHKDGYDAPAQPVSVAESVSGLVIVMGKSVSPIRVLDARTAQPLEFVEVSVRGSASVQLALDVNGTGNLPRSWVGRNITVSQIGYEDTVVSQWDGRNLEVRLDPARLH